MFSGIKAWLYGAVGLVIAGLVAALKIVGLQRDNAKRKAEAEATRADTAEKRIEQRQKADTASSAAKEEGEKNVQEAVDRARTGKRDHFESGL